MKKITWHKFDRNDPNTYPKTEHKKYLITYTSPFFIAEGKRETAILYWNTFDKWEAWEADGSTILFWAEFGIEPCMK